ncbi:MULTISPECIES: hypothetical protein [Metabacillus]|uniref:Uncharacterized protein n=1 Tax=Metabacillus rhizolycopersici TaxID=2875709 RepID=A0ABS7UMB0_9BACI|nr:MULTISPECIES: hypothetical protein [Metabacillus]MBZ5749453.1 hypothetical protein [Metabacillus rhizolycopersici]MCM3653226.1 hypothetical protein [Metabacillus litoralis]
MAYKSIVVLGHSEYYPKFGFMTAYEKGIIVSFEMPSEAFMIIELIPNSPEKRSWYCEVF